jgi:A/G-specific adenine glycosylase
MGVAGSPVMTTIAARATAWYDRTARDLPWRQPGASAWGVIVSEVMLQQTPVARVEPVWREWMDRWPLPGDLAAEPAGEAIRAWGRLGYPRRALRLHASAGQIVQHHGGVVPDDVEQLLQLPGIGAYTARAVAVFAYGQRHPVVDTNVRRLIGRAVYGEPTAALGLTTRDHYRVELLLPRQPAAAARASIAFMELGALVCTARTPACDRCPLRRTCAWRAAEVDPPTPAGLDATSSTIAGRRRAIPPARRSPGYVGTDRQVRGLLLAVLRATTGPVRKPALDAVWPEPVQRERALTSLLADGLVIRDRDRYSLP